MRSSKALSASNLTYGNFRKLIEGMANGSIKAEGLQNPQLLQLHDLIDSLKRTGDQVRKDFFKDLILFLDSKNCDGLMQDRNAMFALYLLSGLRTDFERDFKTWKKRSANSQKQLISFVNHCLAKYPVPAILEHSWFTPKNKYVRWYMITARGGSLRKEAYMPFPMTKKMQHWFFQADPKWTMNEALRWAQVIGLGSSRELAEILRGSLLGRNDFEVEDYWSTVIHFFIRSNHTVAITEAAVNRILDYLNYCRYEDELIMMKGRSFRTLIRDANRWHEQMAKADGPGQYAEWDSCRIDGIDLRKGTGEKKRVFRFEEITNSRDLYREGKVMQHCVFSYLKDCCRGRSAIYSLNVTDYLGVSKKLATIEIEPTTKRVVQAYGKFNQILNKESMYALKHWSEHSRLKVASWIRSELD